MQLTHPIKERLCLQYTSHTTMSMTMDEYIEQLLAGMPDNGTLQNVVQNLTDPPQFALLEKAGRLKEYTAMVPLGHRLEADALTFLNTESKHHSADTKRDRGSGRCEVLAGFNSRAGEVIPKRTAR